jgi:hypothetical protein
MTYSGSVVVEKKIFKWPLPILYFCDYLSFEEDLALKLNNLESPLPKDNLYQVWLKLACWFWRSFFFNINTGTYGFSYCGLTRTPGTMMWTILNLNFHVNITYSGSMALTPPHFCNYFPFEEDLAFNLNNLEFPLPKNDLYQVWLKLAGWFWRR